MIGILLLTHENFGEAMLKSAELVVGNLDCCVAEGLYRGDDIATFGKRVKTMIEEMDKGEGVLVFADLFGASPYNATAMASMKMENKFKCVTGFSFPMLLEALMMRSAYSLDELAMHCMQAGRDGIKELFLEMEQA